MHRKISNIWSWINQPILAGCCEYVSITIANSFEFQHLTQKILLIVTQYWFCIISSIYVRSSPFRSLFPPVMVLCKLCKDPISSTSRLKEGWRESINSFYRDCSRQMESGQHCFKDRVIYLEGITGDSDSNMQNFINNLHLCDLPNHKIQLLSEI